MTMFTTRERDPMLRRFERNQVLATLAMAAAAAIARRLDVALAIVGGGALMATSYWAIRGGIDAVLSDRTEGGAIAVPDAGSQSGADARSAGRARSRGTRRKLLLVAKFVGRYALLALAAYVMLVRLRAHPVGLLVGAISPVVAVAIEAVRVARAWSRPGQPR